MTNGKFKALVHYIIHQFVDDPSKLGALRLNKALWFIDVIQYQITGTPVTNEKYVKRKKGPVPKTILSTLEKLKSEKKIRIEEPKHQFDSRKLISEIEPKTNVFTEDELELVKWCIDFVCGKTTNEISELTHDRIWEAAIEGEEIPLYATLVSERGIITEKTKKWADSVVKRIEKKKELEMA
ncbi:MAG: Panacea domain-containing protein [Aestuariivita sp.]|nr:Panacea domain-containing protein [Aestuariivita sp.]